MRDLTFPYLNLHVPFSGEKGLKQKLPIERYLTVVCLNSHARQATIMKCPSYLSYTAQGGWIKGYEGIEEIAPPASLESCSKELKV